VNRYATHGALLAEKLKTKPHTYLDMCLLCISTSPWRRILEWLDHNPKWKLVKGKSTKGLTTWRVVKA